MRGAQNRAVRMLLGTGSGQERTLVLRGGQTNPDYSPAKEPEGGKWHPYCSIYLRGRKSSLERSLLMGLQPPISAEGAGHARQAGMRDPQGQVVFSV